MWAGRSNASVTAAIAAIIVTSLFLGLPAGVPSASAGDAPSPQGWAGSGWMPDTNVAANAAYDARPALATDANGNILMAYETAEAGNPDIVFTRSSDAGQTWSTPVSVAASATDEVLPDITTDPFSGRIFVTYQEGTAGATSILVSFSDNGGATWSVRTAFSCVVLCERPRIASEYWNGVSNRQYVVFAGEVGLNDWNWVIVGSTDQGDTWTFLYEGGTGATDVRSYPAITVQRGPDAIDRIVVFYRQGGTYPGSNLWLEWSQNYGASWSQGSWGVNVNSPITIAAAHDGSSLMIGYSTVAPANNIVWATDRDVRTPGSFTAWNWWVGRGYWPVLSVDGQGSTDTSIGGNYHLIAHDVGTNRVLYMRAPVTMQSQASWTPVAVISDEAADASDTYREKGLTAHVRGGTWYAFAAWADARNALSSSDDVWATTPGSRWTFATNPSGLEVVVDGAPQTTPFTRAFPAGTVHTVDASSPFASGPGYRSTFASWSDGGAQAHNLSIGTSDTTLTASYTTEVQLTVVSPHGGVIGDGWYAQGDTAFLQVVSPQDGPAGTRYAFTQWTGDASGLSLALLISMDVPKNVTANWKTQHLVTVTSSHGEVLGEGWYDQGATATLSLAAHEVTEDGKTWVFTGWSGDATGAGSAINVTVNTPMTLVANWREKGLLETSGGLLLLLIALLAAALLIVALFLRKRRKPQASHDPNLWQTGPPTAPTTPPTESPAGPPGKPPAGPPGPQ